MAIMSIYIYPTCLQMYVCVEVQTDLNMIYRGVYGILVKQASKLSDF